MNATLKNLSKIAAAMLLVMASGSTWADPAPSTITFEGAKSSGTQNGLNNTGNIDASGADGAAVTIRQISNAATYNVGSENAANMNQVGEYNGSALTISGAAQVHIGQGVKLNPTKTGLANETSGNEVASTNNLVKGSITGGSTYISQMGESASGEGTLVQGTGRVVNLTVGATTTTIEQSGISNSLVGGQSVTATSTGGSVTVTQTANDQRVDIGKTGGNVTVTQNAKTEDVDVNDMTAGNLTITQSAEGQVATVNKFDGGTTTINQSDTATASTITLVNDNSSSGNNGHSANYLVTIRQGDGNESGAQTGAYQDANVQYVHGGYNGALNLDAHGTSGARTTVDVKL